MVVESLVEWFLNFFTFTLDQLTILPLPLSFLDVLYDFLCYGTFIIGADFMAILIPSIVMWFTIRFTVGVVVFIWELLPLT